MRSERASAATVVAVVFTCLSIIAVILRQYAQSTRNAAWTLDSWFLLASLIFTLAHSSTIIYGAAAAGYGWDAKDRIRVLPKFQKTIEAGQVLHLMAVALVRITLLLFYRRVFPTPRFVKADNILLFITVCTLVQSAVGTIVANASDRSLLKMDYPAWLVTQAVLNTVLDIATLCLPMFVVRKLHISKRRKYMVAGIFGLGFFCVIASIIRLVFIARLNTQPFRGEAYSGTLYHCTIWAVIEPCTSIIACCLPACAPLLRKENNGLATMIHNVVAFLSIPSLKGRTTKEDSSRKGRNGSAPGGLKKIFTFQKDGISADSYEMTLEDERHLNAVQESRSVPFKADYSSTPGTTR